MCHLNRPSRAQKGSDWFPVAGERRHGRRPPPRGSLAHYWPPMLRSRSSGITARNEMQRDRMENARIKRRSNSVAMAEKMRTQQG